MRSAHFHVHNQVSEARAVAFNLVDDGFAKLVTLLRRPGAVGQFGRAVLHEIRHPVFPGRRDGRIPGRRYDGLDERIIGPAAVLPAVVGPFHGLQRSGKALAAAVDVAVVRHAGEFRHSGQRDVDLAGRAADLEVLRLS